MLDPSYLRSIRDGILNGTIEANNNEALPDGLVGLYDQELFPPTMKWKERSELLHFFLVFALAQKEISADFAAEILGDAWYNHADEDSSKEEKRLQRVNELIQLHSKRFSSAGSGKYRLYHERFRVYVLQKVSEKEIAQFNHKFIELCKTALNLNSEKDIPEKESYALEFFSTHFFIGAMQGETECRNKEHASALKKYAYDQQFWERQIKASKGFEWSKKMLTQMMSWASKFKEDEEVIECALNKVDLHHKEQNDAPRIVQLVADGDIETALARIEKFGDNDKEGLQRKFTLYMLCLIELTLLDSKNKDHAKGAIEKLLKHFDEHVPVDHSVLNWEEFFPHYLVSQILSEIVKLGYNDQIIYDRTNTSDCDNDEEGGANYEKQEIIDILEDEDATRIILLLEQSNHYFNTNAIQSANESIENAIILFEQSSCVFDLEWPTQIAFFRFLITEIVHQKKHDYLQRCINIIVDETRNVAFKVVLNQLAISNDYVLVQSLLYNNILEKKQLDHQKILKNVFAKYLESNQFNNANIILNHLNSFQKEEPQIRIIESFIQNGSINDALIFSKNHLNNEIEVYYKCIVKIALAYKEKGDFPSYKELMDMASDVLEENSKSIDYVEISIFLLNHNEFHHSIQIINEKILNNDFNSVTYSGYLKIISKLAKNSSFVLAIQVAERIDYEFDRIDAYAEISRQMLLNGLIEEAKRYFMLAIDQVDAINRGTTLSSTNERKCRALMEKLIPEWCLKNWPELIESNFTKAFDLANAIEDPRSKSCAFRHIAIGYMKRNELNKALEIVDQNIEDVDIKHSTLKSIVNELLKLNDLLNSLSVIEKIDSIYYFNEAIFDIIKQYINIGDIESAIVMFNRIDLPEENKSKINEIWSLIIFRCIELDNWPKINDYLINLPIGLRNDCLSNIGYSSMKNKGFKYTLNKINIFKEDDIRKFIKAGIYNALDINIVDKEIVLTTCKKISYDISNIEVALSFHSLQQLFFSNLPQEKLDRYNRTLNLQWAIDIKNQLPN